MADQQIDPAIYGARPLDAHPEFQPGQPGSSSYVPPTAVPEVNAVKGSSLVAEGAANLAQENAPRATMLESIGAAMSQWSPVHLYEFGTRPKFDWAQGHNPVRMMGQVDFPLDKEQEKFLLETKSPEDFHYRLENMREQNLAYKAMSDNGATSFAMMALDPGYLAIDVASLGVGRAVAMMGAGTRAARIASAASAAGLNAGIGVAEQQVQPLSDTAVFANAMVHGAATAAFYRAGAVVAKDPDFPSQRLHELSQELQQGEMWRGHPENHPDFVGPVEVRNGVTMHTINAGDIPAPARTGDNLTRSRVAPGGEGNQKVQYAGGTAGGEYNPASNLSHAEQAGIHADGVIHVDSVADIAQHAPSVAKGRTIIDPDAKAVYLPAEDRVFLINGNIKPGDDVRGILLHEVGVHMNAERVLGTERLGRMLSRLEDLALSGNKRAKQAFDDVPKDTPLHLVREEALGYYVERNHGQLGDHFISRFVHGVKETLRRVGLKSLKLSENDIMQLVRKSVKGKKASSFDSTFPHAWHGSPTRGIESLDTAYIGSGEGNTAFGHGHYLTSEKGTALDYRNKESVRRGSNPEDGGLYRVKINAGEHQFIDLDGRVQSATVQAAFEKLGIRPGITGKSAYDYLAKKLGSQKAASEALHAEGVAGNKYATGRTRNSGDKSSNYVVFNNDGVDVAARYSKGASPAGSPQATVAQRIGKSIEWSLHKTMAKFSPESKRVADLLVDDPLSMVGDSVVSQHRAIRADLHQHQIKFEDLLADHMASVGAGLKNRILQPRKTLDIQRGIEREVYMEMLRRNRLSMDGMPINHNGVAPHIKEMADALDVVGKSALGELKRSGVFGADLITEHSGYINRRWDISKIEAIEAKMVAGGLTLDAARLQLRDTMSVAIQRTNGWDAQLASDVAKAILDRARSKGYFEDAAFRRSAGADGLAEVRNILTGSGLSGARMQRVLDVLAGKADEAGKASMLKHRVDMALDESITHADGSTSTLADMLDTNVTSTTERYLDSVSSQAAFARKGLTKSSDITKLRSDMLESITGMTEREQASKLFDNTVASLRGDPVGEELPNFMRKAQAVTQMVGLARAGLFQFTEYSTAMAQYGAGRTVAEMFKEMPFVRTLLGDAKEAGHLSRVLSGNASADLRIRPFISRLEDNFEVPVSDAIQMSLMQAKQLVPYLNALKFVQGHQSRVVGNLIVNTFERGAAGDVKALAALEHYGLESHIMGQIRSDVAAHGMDTTKWSAGTWDAVRGPLNKMMDDAVLRNRTGEIPAFAQFTSTGKFIFTFRSFVLGAHNKVLAGSLNRGGFGGLGLLMLYQFPLTYAITQASNTMAGKKPLSDKEALGAAFGQMGSLGLFSEAVGVALQNKQQFGSPGTIAIDHVYKLGAAAATGSGKATAAAGLSMVPLLSVILPVKAIGENLKGK